MYIYTLCKLQVSESYTLHNFPFIPDVSRAITSEPPKSENQTLVANSTDLLDVLLSLVILDLCSEGTWMVTSKGVACETRSPLPASLAVESTPRVKRTCLLALLDVRNAISPCLRFCCTIVG